MFKAPGYCELYVWRSKIIKNNEKLTFYTYLDPLGTLNLTPGGPGYCELEVWKPKSIKKHEKMGI